MQPNNITHKQERLIKLSVREKGYNPEEQIEFKTQDVDVTQLRETFTTNNYSPIKWKDGKRKGSNFIGACGFCLDFDKGIFFLQSTGTLIQRVRKDIASS